MKRTRKHQRRHTRRQKGSAFLAKGSYGCVYKPAFRCEGNAQPLPGMVTKFMFADEAWEEFEETRFLENIDPEMKYFIYPKSICTSLASRTNSEKKENPLEKCGPNFKNNYFSMNYYALLQIPDAGRNWDEIESASFPKLFRSFLNVAEGLQALHNHNYVHMDIKPTNIVAKQLDDGTFHSRILDFGLNFNTTSNIRPGLEEKFLSNYAFWPYDLRFLFSFFHKESITKESLEHYFLNKQRYLLQYTPIEFPAVGYDKAIIVYKKIWDVFQEKMRMNKHLAYDYIAKPADIYALAKTFSVIYSKATNHRISIEFSVLVEDFDKYTEEEAKFHILLAKTVSLPFYSLINEMMFVFPSERASISKVITELNKIITAFEKIYEENKVVADAIFVKRFK